MEKPDMVILDGFVANPGDMSWELIESIGNLTIYDETANDAVIERSLHADILITNKTRLGREQLTQLPKLKLICLLATGMDNIDLVTAKELGIEVRNAVGYSTKAVAQHFFALMFALTNHVSLHNQAVHEGEWSENNWCFWKQPILEISGKKLGIYGFGKIGRQIAQIAYAFGMKIMVTSEHASPDDFPNYQFGSLDQLFQESDIISLNAPATPQTNGLINKVYLDKMKPTAVLINTARGVLVNENDLKEALTSNSIRGYATDVLSKEPPPKDHPLLGVKNCIITPHLAWAAKESRERLIKIVADNIRHFIQNK